MEPAPRYADHQLASRRLSEVGADGAAAAYRALLKPNFPAAELMTLEELDEARRSGQCDGWVLLRDMRPVAVMVTEDYLDGRVRLLSYLAVAEEARGHGLGQHLLATLARDREPLLVLAEIQDPRFHGPEHSGDPDARLRFYARNGWGLLPLDYFQPSLRPGSPRVARLLLITVSPPTSSVDGGLVAAFLDEYFHACEAGEALGDEDVRRLLAAARGGVGGRLPVFPLAELHRARPDPDGA